MIIVLLLGLTVGVILALTGAGGGILAVPLLVFGAGLSMAEAGPIGLLAVGLAATLGAVMGLKNGTVRYKAALLIATAGIISLKPSTKLSINPLNVITFLGRYKININKIVTEVAKIRLVSASHPEKAVNTSVAPPRYPV